jgi:hypothetical protein
MDDLLGQQSDDPTHRGIHLCSQFNISPEHHRWTIYLDNKAMIQRIEGYISNIKIPRWNLRADEDITNVAYSLLTKIPAQLTHVKSHQDNNKDQQLLPYSAQLNIMADEQATHQCLIMEEPEADVLKLSRTQLRINNIAITRDSQRWLLHSAGKIPLQAYYNKRWGWTDRIFDSINWKTQHSALQTFDTHDQTRILKFVHGWLPTQHRLYKEGNARTPKCKLCHELYEDNLHLFSCKHPHMGQIQEEITTYLAKSLHEHGNSELTNILDIALGECTTSTTWQPDIRFASKE